MNLQPDNNCSKSMLQMHYSWQWCQLDFSFDFNIIASLTEGFSVSDIKLLCKDEAVQALWQIIVQLDTLNPVSKASSSALLKTDAFSWYRNK
jgi:SpoVK/Ycf46/Vps4 family AAA+-type ATPase